jgi:hypothetical protein
MCGCEQKSLPAFEVEAQVWELVSSLLKAPDRIRAGMNRLIEEERTRGRAGDPEQEARALADSMAESDRLRAAYQDQQAVGYMTLTELGAKLKELEATRRLAQAELEHLLAHKERVEELEQDRDVLLDSYAESVPEGLDGLSGGERNRLYGMLRLESRPPRRVWRSAALFIQLNSPQQLRYRTGFPGRRGHGEGPIKQRWYHAMIRLRGWTAWSCRSSAAGRSI